MKNKLLTILTVTALLATPIQTLALKKSETIYTNLNYDGSTIETNVSNHLSFINKEEIEDKTELQNILNLSGREEYRQTGERLTWFTENKDIFYRGTTDKAIPITTTIEYYINDELKPLDELIGKKGHIRIAYHFKNENKNHIRINDHYETMYTPYLVTLGTVLDETVKNVEIENGRVVSTGSRTLAVALASPGLYASTHLAQFANFDSIELEFDTDNFTLGTTYIISTPKILAESDLSIFGKMNILSNSIDELETNIAKLESGAQELESGAKTLQNGTSALSNNLYKAQVSLKQIEEGSITLDAGVDKMISTLLATKNSLADPTVNPEIGKLNDLVAKNKATLAKLESSFTGAGLDLASIKTACLDTTLTNPLLSNDTVATYCLIAANEQTIEGITPLLTSQIDAVLNGLNELKKGSTALISGLSQINGGLEQLYAGAKTLEQGTLALHKGANSLSNGTTEFKKRGIDKLATTTDNILNVGEKLQTLTNLSKNYKGFTSNNADETIFVSMIPSYRAN